MEDVQARIDADALLAERLQQEEKEQFIVDEQARMLVDLIAERKRFFAAQRANKLETRHQPKLNSETRCKKRSRVDHDKENVKKQKLEEEDAEKEELRVCLDIVSVDDIAINVESLATKCLIVDWKIHT
nr:hypothetical protein [Tanacetum cinerariifolium]